MTNFTHLHVHSQLSLLDGLNSPEELVLSAKEQGQTAIAITDHGVLSGHRQLQKAATQHGIKPLLGVEAYLSPTDRFDRRSAKKRDDNTQVYNHMCLIAQHQAGLDNLNTLSRIAWTEGFYHKPRMDREILEQYSDGVIALSGCFNGIASKAIEADDFDTAREYLLWMRDVFGENAYVEVQPHNTEKINQYLLDYADEFGMPAVATADCHYADRNDRALEDAWLVLSTKPKLDKQAKTDDTMGLLDKLNTLYPDRFMSFQDIDVFLGTRADLQTGMERQGFDRADIYENTQRVTDSVGDYEFYEDLDLLPSDFDDPNAALENRVLDGLSDKGIAGPAYIERMSEEMRVIRKKNFAPYFLVVNDMVRYAHEQGIFVGPGRGSAAGSLICYALGITDVDPLKYNLLFARFINEERNDFPDIDLDFEDRRRGEIKDYLQRKYGHIASIATYSYFKDAGAIKAAGRVLNVSFGEMNNVTSKVSDFEDFVRTKNPDVVAFRNKHPDVVGLAAKIRGRIASQGMHAGGVVVANKPIELYAPVQSNKDPNDPSGDRIPVVSYDMDEVAEIGLIKFDILGLTSLTAISETIDLIKQNHDVDIVLKDIDLNDIEIYKRFGEGDTVGVFQAEAAPYTNLLEDMQITEFNQLVASNALVRPGAMNTVGPEFIARMHGKAKVTYVHESVRQFLEDTYGVVIYQEQVMQLAVALGDFTWAEADKLRKIIGKKKDVSEFDAYRDKFVDAAADKIGRKTAEDLWHDFEAHAGYSFNKSHAVAYSMLTYYSAWLKHYYPREYMVAILRAAGSNKEKVTTYLTEVTRLGIEVANPDVNESGYEYELVDGKVRPGLANIKYLSEKVASNVMAQRPYASADEFRKAASTRGSGINSRAVEALRVTRALAPIGEDVDDETYNEHVFEYLRIPNFSSHEISSDGERLLTSAYDFPEEGVHVLRAYVKSIRREKHWGLVEFADESGSCAVFSDPDINMEKGNVYYVLTAGKNISDYLLESEIFETNKPLAGLLRFSHAPLIDKPGVFVVSFTERTTKAGNKMGTLVVYGPETGFGEIVVFEDTLRKARAIAKPGSMIAPRVSKSKQGGLVLKDIE